MEKIFLQSMEVPFWLHRKSYNSGNSFGPYCETASLTSVGTNNKDGCSSIFCAIPYLEMHAARHTCIQMHKIRSGLPAACAKSYPRTKKNYLSFKKQLCVRLPCSPPVAARPILGKLIVGRTNYCLLHIIFCTDNFISFRIMLLVQNQKHTF